MSVELYLYQNLETMFDWHSSQVWFYSFPANIEGQWWDLSLARRFARGLIQGRDIAVKWYLQTWKGPTELDGGETPESFLANCKLWHLGVHRDKQSKMGQAKWATGTDAINRSVRGDHLPVSLFSQKCWAKGASWRGLRIYIYIIPLSLKFG